MRSHDADVIERMLAAIDDGEVWHKALLAAIAEWQQPEELLSDGRTVRYLYGGDAFDWLALAERLCDELDGRAPPDEREALILRGALPEKLNDEEFQRRIGAEKYSSHLNYLYGVQVEEALQLAVEEELLKELRSSAGGANGSIEDAAFVRIYGKPVASLIETYCEETGGEITGDELTLTELREFTYWLFRYRVRRSEPARIASDTRKGLAQLSRLEMARLTSPLHIHEAPHEVIEATVR